MVTDRLEEVGRKVRHLRRLRGLSLRALSQQCGLSVGFLSQIERGLSSFSIPSLQAICAALDVSLADMLVMTNGPGMAFLVDPRPTAITKGDNRSYLSLSDTSIRYRFLSAKFPGRRFEVLIGEMTQGSCHEVHVHDGEEFGYVLEGLLEVTIGEDSYGIGRGDSYHVLGTTPHRCSSSDSEGAKVLWVQTARYARAIAILGAGLPEAVRAPVLGAPPQRGGDNSLHVKLSDSTATYRFLSGTLPAGSLEVLVAEIPSSFGRGEIAYGGEEFGYVLDGRVQLRIAEELYALGAGDCYHLPTGTPHDCTTEVSGGAKLLLARMPAMVGEADEAWQAVSQVAASRALPDGGRDGQPSGGSDV
jgi:quercetin dioxygenase-like cupin family protein/DNA-binding Xre family transcriptional regulator